MDILEKIVTVTGAIVVGAIILGIALFITAFITWWAWNALMPHAFHLPEINYWQALAFNFLANQFRSSTPVSTKK